MFDHFSGSKQFPFLLWKPPWFPCYAPQRYARVFACLSFLLRSRVFGGIWVEFGGHKFWGWGEQLCLTSWAPDPVINAVKWACKKGYNSTYNWQGPFVGILKLPMFHGNLVLYHQIGNLQMFVLFETLFVFNPTGAQWTDLRIVSFMRGSQICNP